MPWQFVGAIHAMETGLRFTRHLHNGDTLSARTVRVPAGRPAQGAPPYDWAASARDALELKALPAWRDWSVAGMLYQLERYNGWGYRRWHPSVPTPYLWSYSNHYERGKYVADGVWDPHAVSKQCGAAVLLRRMVERGRMAASLASPAAPTAAPLIAYYTGGPEQPLARAFQEFLNTLPGIEIDADGKPGQKTSDATRRALGHYLVCDPRERLM
jgi:lysozyme family protein